MESIVPAPLQRLRPADIMQMAGLMSASLGQEYCRVGAVHDTRRQGARLSGRVDLSLVANEQLNMEAERAGNDERRQFVVEVEVKSATSWTSRCQCNSQTPRLLCPHAAALLYQWLAHPTGFTFALLSSTVADSNSAERSLALAGEEAATGLAVPISTRPSQEVPTMKPARPSAGGAETIVRTTPAPLPLNDLHSILTQLALSELRGIAREYEIVTNGVSKPQLAELILAKLRLPEAVRRVASTLEKHQRQLLAAVTLAGGSITDEDLRGLYDRFGLGQPAQLQGILLVLQNKALLFRAGLNSVQPRTGLSSTLLDIGWYVPVEVRAALRVTMPATPFSVEPDAEKDFVPALRQTEPYTLQADLLLIAHTLDGYRLDAAGSWTEPPASPDEPAVARSSHDGSLPIPPPTDLPPSSLLHALRANITGTPTFLRFAVSLLRQAGLLYKDDDDETPCLRVLPNTSSLLLGPGREETLHDLFELWLTQSSYGELYELREHQIRLRCRSSSLNIPILRSGELEAENSEARQTIIALLAQAPSQQWISFAAFARFVYRLIPLFLQRRQRLYPAPHWWMEQEPGRPLRPLQSQDWARAEYHYLSYLVSGPLHWWGVCDIALAEDGRLLAFRLTPTATRLLTANRDSGGSRSDQESAQNYSIPPDSLEIVDPAELVVACSVPTWPIIEVLESFAEPAGARHDRLSYRLTPKSLGAALSRGLCPAMLLDPLRALAQDTLAHQRTLLDALIAQLERWIASYGRVRLYTGVTLLEVADGTAMRELSATTSLDEQIVLSITPTIHILTKTATERLPDELKRRGQAPLVHDEDA